MDFKKLARIQDSADRKADDMKVSKVSPIGNDRSLKYAEDEDGTFYLSVEDKDGVVFGVTIKNDLSAEGDDDLMERLQKTDFYPFKEKNDVMRAYRQIVKSYKKEDAIDDTVVKQSENSEQIIDSDVTTTAIVELGAQYLIGQVTSPEVKDDMVAYYHRGVTEDEPEFYLCFLLNEAIYVFSVNGKEEERGGFVSVRDIDEIFKNTETIFTEYLEKVQDSEDETKPKFRNFTVNKTVSFKKHCFFSLIILNVYFCELHQNTEQINYRFEKQKVKLFREWRFYTCRENSSVKITLIIFYNNDFLRCAV